MGWGGAGRHCVASISTTMGAAAGAMVMEGSGCAVSETTVSLSESEELSSGADPSWMGSTGVWEIGMAVRGRDGGGARESAAGWVREAEAEAEAVGAYCSTLLATPLRTHRSAPVRRRVRRGLAKTKKKRDRAHFCFRIGYYRGMYQRTP